MRTLAAPQAPWMGTVPNKAGRHFGRVRLAIMDGTPAAEAEVAEFVGVHGRALDEYFSRRLAADERKQLSFLATHQDLSLIHI